MFKIMIFLHIFLLLLLTICTTLGKNCDNLGILIYEDLGCTPEQGSDQNCPTKYTCKGMEPWKNHCHFRGKSYTIGEAVDKSLTYPTCQIGCFCSQYSKENPHFTCAALDCAEWLGAPVNPGCYRKYALGECCSLGQVCPPFDNIEKCVVEGKEYREGETFHPANTCLTCVCQKGFKGKFEEPFCKRRLCGDQLRRDAQSIQSSCAPFYRKSKGVLCCPDDWICPAENEVIKGEATSEETCKFGNNVVKVGQYVERSNFKDSWNRSFNNVKCECVIPPLLKCSDV